MLVVKAAVACVPEMPFVPVQPPDALQLVALVDDHVSFDVPPDATDAGDALSVTVGAAPLVTVNVAEVVFVPPDPEQVSW